MDIIYGDIELHVSTAALIAWAVVVLIALVVWDIRHA